jgi:hypothetical protein
LSISAVGVGRYYDCYTGLADYTHQDRLIPA